MLQKLKSMGKWINNTRIMITLAALYVIIAILYFIF